MEAEGWYRDPYELHVDRWFSVGRPTALVRDDGVESHDEPPAGEIPGPLVEADGAAPADGEDLKRADAATSEDQSWTHGQGPRAALDGSGTLGIGFS